VTFDCSANGTMSVIANVTKPVDGSPCTEQARVDIQCLNQGTQAPRCGDGIINQPSEQCDGTAFPPNTPTGTTCSATCTTIPPVQGPRCGDGIINQPSEQCDGTAFPPNTPTGTTCSSTCTTIPPVTQGACLQCAQTSCPTQYANAIGSASSPTNLADVTQLFDCVIGPNWEAGGAIPQTSCFFADPAQPLGSLLPCYCGNTPQATCLATGPTNNQDACGLEVELASDCSPVSASCVTGSGSNPEVPLGDVLQLLNCERAACGTQCGFPQIEE
jgi:cysteine-rich repeat protein